jgi:3-hydroxybutyryl-CoA dehydrogenase
MKILVVGNADQAAECRGKFGPLHHYTVCPSWMTVNPALADTNVVFDFVSAGSSSTDVLPKALVQDIFVDTTMTRLADWKSRRGLTNTNVYGFCGLKTFLSREVLEVAVSAEGKPQDLERICLALGTSYQVVADQVGMVTPRVICMIINEAYFTLAEGTASRNDIDLAMKLGTNYPFGPFEWADRIGLKNVVSQLEAVYRETRDERYRTCPLLIEKAGLA